MSELFFEILTNSTLNKNTSTLVESYLLEPPPLPFIDELCECLSRIKGALDIYHYYENHVRYISTRHHKYMTMKNIGKLGLFFSSGSYVGIKVK